MADLEPPGLDLAAVLERALLATDQLRDALTAAAGYHAEAIAYLARARALTESGVRHDARSCPHATLSPREAEVLVLLAGGHSNRQIAHTLCLSPRTVQRHVANLYLKIGAHNRADATAYALRHRLR